MSFLAVVLGMFAGGCSTVDSSANNVPRVAIALNIAGGGSPSPQQAAEVQQSLAGAMAKAGLQFARSADQADYIVTATLTLDPVDPREGHLKIGRIEPAPRGERDRPNALRASRSADAMTGEIKALQENLRQFDAWSQTTTQSAAIRTDNGR